MGRPLADSLTKGTKMTKGSKRVEHTPEIDAISAVYSALRGLDPSVQVRVLRYAAEMLGIDFETPHSGEPATTQREQDQNASTTTSTITTTSTRDQSADDVEGINAIALRWMRRSGLDAKSLQALFSLGVDEIDLVAKKVPGDSKRERMRNTILLKGIAAYLGTGAPRVSYEQVKEACLHYNAYDLANFARYLKEFAPEVGGTKEAGFTLSARGLNSATELVRSLLTAKK